MCLGNVLRPCLTGWNDAGRERGGGRMTRMGVLKDPVVQYAHVVEALGKPLTLWP